MRWRAAVAAGCVAVSLSSCGSCEVSQVDPDAKVTLRGQVSGRQPGDVPVRLTKRPDAGELLGGAALVLGTLDLVCAGKDGPAICGDAHTARTDSHGRFHLTLKGSDTQGTFRNADDLDLTAGPAVTGGPSTVATFQVQHTDLRLPLLRLWPADIRATVGSGAVRATWTPLPARFLAPGAGHHTAVVFDRGPGEVIWTAAHARSGAPVDLRVLEGQAQGVSAETQTERALGGTSYALTYASGRAGVAPTDTPKPVSRGAGCGTAQTPCWLTDGDLTTGGASAQTRARIDLGRAVPAALIVVHGCPDSCRVSTSADGTRFTTLATAPTGDRAFAARGRSVRYVQLESASLSQVHELSVWSSAQPAGGPIGPARLAGITLPGGHGHGRRGFLVALLVLLAVFALGLAVGRRRRA